MFPTEPVIVRGRDQSWDEALEEVPTGPAVFAIWPYAGEPYLARTAFLRRRLKRLLREQGAFSRLLNLRALADRLEYWPTASRLESTLVLYDLARQHFPDRYLRFLKLRMPAYVKIILSNAFPRTQVTTKLSAGAGQWYGPFRTRGAAELFEHEVLDLFQVRRCQEDLDPSPDHPGCIYGEMNMCLRPCQQVVGSEEYASEVNRLSDFLRTAGKGMIQAAEAARERLSAELDFEEAARQHKRIERIVDILKLRDELAVDIERLNGVAITPSTEPGAVSLWFVLGGTWLPVRTFSVALTDQSVSMDRRVRELVSNITPVTEHSINRQEHLAILARWFYSSWRDGEWLQFESLDRLPYRRLIGAISRMADRAQALET